MQREQKIALMLYVEMAELVYLPPVKKIDNNRRFYGKGQEGIFVVPKQERFQEQKLAGEISKD